MKNIFTVLIIAFLFTTAKAQTYAVTSIPYNPLPFDSGIRVVTPIDDSWGTPVGIGFDFYFFGIPYQSLVVGTNSILSFDSTQSGLTCNWDLTSVGSLPTNNTYPKRPSFD